MDPAVVGPMLSDPEEIGHLFAGRAALDVPLLFSNLQGFTQLTRQRTRDGQGELHLIQQLNTCLDRMRGPKRLCDVLLRCQAALNDLNRDGNGRSGESPPLASGIGIASSLGA